MASGRVQNTWCVALLRFLLAAWVGAAVLYVITSVAEQISPDFDSRIRDQLATIRFPIYYKFGAFIYGATAVLAVAVWRLQPESHRHIIILGLIAVSGAIYAWDYFQIYVPLQELITPPGQVRTQEFVRLHTLSRNVNVIHLSMMLIAGLISCVPASTTPEPAAD